MAKRLLTSDEIKEIELEILLEFSGFCQKNNLRFYLTYGTLLGAVRHKGFIPWDDDIDVIMPRPDYERFLEIYKPFEEKFLLRSNRLNNFNAPFSKLVNVNTVVESFLADGDIDTNLWIDIFPVDGLPESDDLKKKIYDKSLFYIKMLMLINSRYGVGSNIIKRYAKYILKPLAALYGKNRCIRNLETLGRKYDYSDSQYVGMIVWLSGGVKEKMLKTDFEQSTEVEFEGHKFPAVACWDKYLTNIYGDYMQLPPVEKRRTHNMVAYKIE